jgi:GNAT superfamily N-acetyltransferase
MSGFVSETAVDAFDVRVPTDTELPACRLMLPEVFATGTPFSLIAVSAAPKRYLGVAVIQDVSSKRGRAWRLRLHVVPPYRRRGVGRRLLDAVVARARQADVQQLAAVVTDEDGPSSAFLKAVGFRHAFRAERFEADVEARAGEAAEVYERLRAKGRIPATARPVRLHEAPREPLLELLAAPAGDVTARNPGLPHVEWSDRWRHASISDLSPVLMLDDRPVGVVVAERRGVDTALMKWRVVAPEHRMGWANIVLGCIAVDWMLRSGVRRTLFDSTTLTTDTERLTRLYGCPRIAVKDHWVLTLTGERE